MIEHVPHATVKVRRIDLSEIEIVSGKECEHKTHRPWLRVWSEDAVFLVIGSYPDAMGTAHHGRFLRAAKSLFAQLLGKEEHDIDEEAAWQALEDPERFAGHAVVLENWNRMGL